MNYLQLENQRLKLPNTNKHTLLNKIKELNSTIEKKDIKIHSFIIDRTTFIELLDEI